MEKDPPTQKFGKISLLFKKFKVKSRFPDGSDPLTKSKFQKIKMILIVSIILFFCIIGVVLARYYLIYYSAASITNRAFSSLISAKSLKYKGIIKLTFSYLDAIEKIDLNDIEVYSLLKRSASDNHIIQFSGEHTSESDVLAGTYFLTWEIADKKIFSLDGNYRGYELNYKVNPYEYSDLVGDKFKNEYSHINISDLEKKILPENYSELVKNVNPEDFKMQVIEEFQNDMINKSNSYHYKTKLLESDNLNNLYPGAKDIVFDVWIDKKTEQINKIKTQVDMTNFGIEGNSINITLDLDFQS